MSVVVDLVICSSGRNIIRHPRPWSFSESIVDDIPVRGRFPRASGGGAGIERYDGEKYNFIFSNLGR